MGICVLGNKVIVSCLAQRLGLHLRRERQDHSRRKSCSPRPASRSTTTRPTRSSSGPTASSTGTSATTASAVHDKDGKPVVDLAGNVSTINGKPYRGGMVFRCNLDGSQFEVLAHNFRNNYEVAVDSFGTLWQSDNDDDGNRGVRINYVMEYGNYGYIDEMTGAGWQAKRTNMETEIPLRHWHLNDPGVVPNLLQTGQGSPTGICVYEGTLLPKVFHNQIIHCDAGPEHRPRLSGGQGRRRLQGRDRQHPRRQKKNNWFRPVDVCIAPDGSLFVTDWYDPGVGGHGQRDLDRGRIFRVAPPGMKVHGAEVRFQHCRRRGRGAEEPEPGGALPRLDEAARAAGKGRAGPAEAVADRTTRATGPGPCGCWARSRARGSTTSTWPCKDARSRHPHHRPSPGPAAGAGPGRGGRPKVVQRSGRRRCAAMPPSRCGTASRRGAELWAELARQHDGKDRWYLEALGIGADGSGTLYLDAWLKAVGDRWNSPAGRDVVWRSRASQDLRLPRPDHCRSRR